MLRSRQAKLKRDISLIDDILRESKMSEAHLRMLVEKILVHEEDGRLDLEIRLKAPFRDHLDVFENGAQTDCIPSMDFDYVACIIDNVFGVGSQQYIWIYNILIKYVSVNMLCQCPDLLR